MKNHTKTKTVLTTKINLNCSSVSSYYIYVGSKYRSNYQLLLEVKFKGSFSITMPDYADKSSK